MKEKNVTPEKIINNNEEGKVEDNPSLLKQALVFAKEHPMDVVQGALELAVPIVTIIYKMKTSKAEIECWKRLTLEAIDKLGGFDKF